MMHYLNLPPRILLILDGHNIPLGNIFVSICLIGSLFDKQIHYTKLYLAHSPAQCVQIPNMIGLVLQNTRSV